MRILFCGDVVGRSGREAVAQHIPVLRKKLGLDVVVVNGENAASGFGVTRKICDDFLKNGVDVITGGDHCFDQKEVALFIDSYHQLLRPANFPDTLPGTGCRLYEIKGKRVLVLHLHAQLFMKLNADNPFMAADEWLSRYKLGRDADAIIVDFHGEASSERMAMGHYLDGRVSVVSGSHTHVPTADIQILPNGTAYQTDAGMCGDYDSVIGFKKEIALKGFTHRIRFERMQPAKGEGTLCGLFVETDDETGLAVRTEPVQLGGRLRRYIPEIDM